jgi:transposase
VKTQQEILTYLQDTFGVCYTQAGVCVLLKRLKVKLKTSRPSNIRKVEGSEETFKKKDARPLSTTP